MIRTADKIMKRIRSYGRGNRVFAAADFLDLGSRDAVDQCLSRLVRREKLRRVRRGLYDLPRISKIVDKAVPASIDNTAHAIARRNNLKLLPDGLSAANALGLTNAVPAKSTYVTNGPTRSTPVGNRVIEFHHADPSVMYWHKSSAALVAQALRWLGPNVSSNPDVILKLKDTLSDDQKRDLWRGVAHLPGWCLPVVKSITDHRMAG